MMIKLWWWGQLAAGADWESQIILLITMTSDRQSMREVSRDEWGFMRIIVDITIGFMKAADTSMKCLIIRKWWVEYRDHDTFILCADIRGYHHSLLAPLLAASQFKCQNSSLSPALTCSVGVSSRQWQQPSWLSEPALIGPHRVTWQDTGLWLVSCADCTSWLSEEGAAGPGVAILTQSKLHSIDQWTLATVSTTTYCQPGDLARSVSYQDQEETTQLWNVKIKKESCWNTFQRESNNLYPDIEVKKLMDWVICVSDRWTGSSDVFTHCLQSSDKIYQTNILTAWPELFICCWTRLLPSKFCLINNLNTLSNMILSN